jgi:hypothetical protein
VTYDPDGDPDALDIHDPAAVMANLDNPTVKALHEDLGRAFVTLPPAEQIDEIAPQLMRQEAIRDELTAALVGAPDDDLRHALLGSLNELIAQMRVRIAELRDHPLA